MSGEGFEINPDELHSGADQLGQFSDRISTSLGKLRNTHQNLTSHARSDKSGVGAVVVKAAGKSEEVLGDVAQEGARVAKGASQRIHTGAKAHTENEEKQTGVFKGIKNKGDKTAPVRPSGSGQGSTSGQQGPGAGTRAPKKSKPPKSTTPVPALSGHKPPTANDTPSKVFTNDPALPKPVKPNDKLPSVDANNPSVPPPKPARGAKVEQIDESRVDRDKTTGLITHVDGKPVKDYVGGMSQQRAEALSANGPNGKPLEGRCSAVAIDLKTGLVTQGVNGGRGDVIPPHNLHPLLQQNLQDMRAWQHPVQGKDGTVSVHDGKAHYSQPASHAEVKATNELLWQRQSQLGPGETLPPSTLNELRFDPRWTAQTGADGSIGSSAAACANCNSILHGVPSYSGRCEYDPKDSRYQNPSVPPVGA
jgi:hypothetical protein